MTDVSASDPTVSTIKRILFGLLMGFCLVPIGAVFGSLFAKLFVSSSGWDALADAIGFLMLGMLGGAVLGFILAVVLSPSKLKIALRTSIVLGVIGYGLFAASIYMNRQAVEDARQEALEARPTAPAQDAIPVQ